MATEQKIRCGFIGLGSQGAPIAMRMILSGLPTVLWARRPESLAAFDGSDADFAGSIAELAEEVDHVGICVLSDADVIEVCRELIPALARGSCIAVHSTVRPETVRTIAREASEQGVDVIDAPVSGGEPAARAGTLTVMTGGDRGVIERALPVFRAFGSLIPHLGEVGAGQNAKLVNNALLAANMAVADHALAAAVALGIDKGALMELLAASSGRSYGLEVRGQLPTARAFGHGGSLLLKDLRLLCEVLGDDAGAMGLRAAAMPFLENCVGADEQSSTSQVR